MTEVPTITNYYTHYFMNLPFHLLLKRLMIMYNMFLTLPPHIKNNPQISCKNDEAIKIMIKTQILLWKTIGNKRFRVRVRFILSYFKLAPTDPWCNMLQTLLGWKKYQETMSDEHPTRSMSNRPSAEKIKKSQTYRQGWLARYINLAFFFSDMHEDLHLFNLITGNLMQYIILWPINLTLTSRHLASKFQVLIVRND